MAGGPADVAAGGEAVRHLTDLTDLTAVKWLMGRRMLRRAARHLTDLTAVKWWAGGCGSAGRQAAGGPADVAVSGGAFDRFDGFDGRQMAGGPADIAAGWQAAGGCCGGRRGICQI